MCGLLDRKKKRIDGEILTRAICIAYRREREGTVCILVESREYVDIEY